MQSTIRYSLAVAIILAVAISAPNANELGDNLDMFRDLLGTTWEGHFEDADEPMTLYMVWEPIIEGASVQMSGWSSAADMTRRNIYYWDREKKQVAYLAMTSNGYVATGIVQFEGGVLTFLGRQIDPDANVRESKSRWEFNDDGTVRVVGYGKEGDKWVPGHKILFERVKKE
jgi:hypothetical protein